MSDLKKGFSILAAVLKKHLFVYSHSVTSFLKWLSKSYQTYGRHIFRVSTMRYSRIWGYTSQTLYFDNTTPVRFHPSKVFENVLNNFFQYDWKSNFEQSEKDPHPKFEWRSVTCSLILLNKHVPPFYHFFFPRLLIRCTFHG